MSQGFFDIRPPGKPVEQGRNEHAFSTRQRFTEKSRCLRCGKEARFILKPCVSDETVDVHRAMRRV
jgi:hypothetical protein